MPNSHHLTAILFADIQGYTAMMQHDEVNAKVIRDKFKKAIEAQNSIHDGRIIQFSGDGAFCIFNSSIEAVRAAIAIQLQMLEAPMVPLRIGINTGDVMFEEDNVYGDGVNIASRIESFGVAGSIFISGRVQDDIKNQKDIQTVFLGKFDLKNVVAPIEIFAISNDGLIVPEKEALEGKGKTASGNKISSAKMLLGIFAALVIVLPGIFLAYAYFKPGKQVAAAYSSIAVLPFENLSNLHDEDYFADGIGEEIRHKLSSILSLKVIAGSSTKGFKNTSKSAKQIGEELGAGTLLTGSVQKQNDRMRIRVQLVDAATNEQLWAENFEDKATDLFAMQTQIAEQVVQQLKTKITEQEKKNMEAVPTTNALAYDYYLQARNIFNTYDGPSRGQIDHANQLLDKARQLDPHFIKAYGFQTLVNLSYHFYNVTTRRDVELEKADSLITMMDAMAPGDPETLLARAYYKYTILIDYDGALEILKNYLKTNTNNAEAYAAIGNIYLQMLELEEAVVMMKKALEVDPKNCLYWGYLYEIYNRQRDAVNAIGTADQQIMICPDDVRCYAYKAYSLISLTGNIAAAQALVDQAPLKDHPEYATMVQLNIYMVSGKIDSALQIVRGWSQDTISVEGDFYCHSFDMGYYLWMNGDVAGSKKYFAAAVNFMNHVIANIPENANEGITNSAYATLAISYAGLGDQAACMKAFAMRDNLDLKKKDKWRQIEMMEQKVSAYILLGKKKEAINTMQLLLQQPFHFTATKNLYRLYPVYNSLRSEPEFQKMMQ
ncbi:MAG TPA: adenylate/guanylate cyclase domain-containing protein [Chitinophagales bacterium]|nr:adenylate/guanylate cyclase domain-containing protein [Chitinophagales bacterium]